VVNLTFINIKGLNKKGVEMTQNINKIFITAFLITMFGCATVPPSEAIFARDYQQRIVRVIPVKHGKVVTVKVHHKGPLSAAERDDLIRYYKSKHRRQNNRVKVVFIRN
jgi:hypothetical protein